MRLHRIPIPEVFTTLHSSPDGLSEPEAARRLAEYGPNRFERIHRRPVWRQCAASFTHFFAFILWTAAALAFLADWHAPGEGMQTLGATITGVILINGFFSFWQEYRAGKTVDALERLLPRRVCVLRAGRITDLPSEALVPGDLLCVEAGDDVPADCRVVEARGLAVNNATLTGESAILGRSPVDEEREPGIEHSRNLILAGTSVVAGEGRAVVFATGARTRLGLLAHLTQSAPAPSSPLQREIARLSRWIAVISVLLGSACFGAAEWMGLSLFQGALLAIGVIVANVPEGLLPTVTVSLAMASQRMARRNALVRHLPAVEALGATSVICTDKTGTLTEGRMAVRQIHVHGRLWDRDAFPDASLCASFYEVAAGCHHLREVSRDGILQLQGDPMELALFHLGRNVLGIASPPEREDEIPFDPVRKRTATLHRSTAGLRLLVKGAVETVLPLCTSAEGTDRTDPLSVTARTALLSEHDAMAGRGLRVLAFAVRLLPEPIPPRTEWERDLVFAGFAGLEDPPRPEVPAALRSCREAGIRVIMLTGDHPGTALAIARETGLALNPHVLTGETLGRMTDVQLQLLLDAPEVLFARVAAEQKLRIVKVLRGKGHVVAVTGDGVNDAPALRSADIGVAMGRSGTDVACEAADLVLLDDNFASIVAAVEEGRAVFANLRKFLTYVLTSNVPELVPYVAFVLLGIPLPLTILQVLAVDIGTDMLPALALGAERPHPGTLREPPRPRSERLLDGALLLRAYVFLGGIASVAAMAAYFYVLHTGGWKWGVALGPHDPLYLRATTACFAAIVVMQVVNVFLCRSRRASAVSFPFWSNPLLLAGVACEILLLLLIVYSPWGALLFGTAPLPPSVWLFLLPFALFFFLSEEIRKSVVRRFWKGAGQRSPHAPHSTDLPPGRDVGAGETHSPRIQSPGKPSGTGESSVPT